MKIYIDFDGVILDTDSTLEKEYSKVNNIDKKELLYRCHIRGVLSIYEII